MLICEAAWGADCFTWQKPTLPIVMITIFMALSHSCPIVFPNMELSVISVSAWIYIWNAWIMQIFSFLLHLTLSSIKSINHPIRWSRWPVVFPRTHKHRMKNCCWAISQKLMGETGHYMFFLCFYGGFRRDKEGHNPPTPSPLCESCYFADYEEAWWSYCFPASGRNVFSPFCLIQEAREGIWAVVCARLVSWMCCTSRKTNTVNIPYSTSWSYYFAHQYISCNSINNC